MNDWVYAAQKCGIYDYYVCSTTLINWQNGILNTFDYPYSNGFAEGCNNRVKVLKRNATDIAISNASGIEYYIWFLTKNNEKQRIKKR